MRLSRGVVAQHHYWIVQDSVGKLGPRPSPWELFVRRTLFAGGNKLLEWRQSDTETATLVPAQNRNLLDIPLALR